MVSGPVKKYRTLVADPPWHYELRKDDPTHRARAPYGTMSVAEILNLPVGMWAEEDAHLYLWTTNAYMAEAHQIAKEWGFDPKTIITWVKGRLDIKGHQPVLIQHMGTGNSYRGSTEHIIFAKRGKLDVRSHDETTAFIAPRGDHSEKPAAFYDMVSSMSPGPYLDVFARAQRWIGDVNFEVMDTYGNQSFNFGTTQPPEAFFGAQA
jgi:N6-adenosine-specific RNA methylase IME4